MEQKKSVGIWIRVSTEDQARGDSPEHHEQRARLYAQSRGWEVKTVYHLEALSGKSVMGYPETKRMLIDVQRGEIEGLIFSKLARLARNTKELLEFADIFQEHGTDLISLQESIDTSTPAGRLFYTMIAAMAQWEREEISDRIAASIPIRAKLGKRIGGLAPIGYKWEGHTFLLDEKFAPIVKLTFDLFLTHKRKKVVARLLNEQGFRTRSGAKFSDGSVHRILRDTCAKGERRANYHSNTAKGKVLKPVEEWVVFECLALVSHEVWNECNRLLDESEQKLKRKGRTSKSLLAGYVRCEQCQKKMYVFHSKTSNPGYYCKPCKIRIPVNDLEEIFQEQLKAFLLTDVTPKEYTASMDKSFVEKEEVLKALLKEKAGIKTKMDRIIELRIGGELSKEAFREHNEPLEEQMKQINSKLPILEAELDILKIQRQSSEVILSDAKELYAHWQHMSFEERRGIVERITESITVGRENIHIQLTHTPTRPKSSRTNSGNGGKKLHDH